MRAELEEMQGVEAFLRGKLTEEKAMEAEIRLLWDREWRQKVEGQRQSYRAIRAAGRQHLRQELQAIHDRLFG